MFTVRRVIAVTLLSLSAAVTGCGSRGGDERYLTQKVERGDFVVRISATGTLQPEELVDVGAQVAGQIASFGLDTNNKPVDYGSSITEGAVLATIDDSLYKAEALAAEAQKKRAQATLEQTKAKLLQAERDWKRAQQVGASKVLAESAYDAYEAAYASAVADVHAADAGILEAQANSDRAQRNLAYTIIRSPVTGVIIDRRVNIGQTVVASLNAPSLFLIAKDLKSMEIWASVNEADVTRVFPGQKVTFEVDALPGESFTGVVQKIRLNASMTQNVVSYIIEIRADNSQGKLLPYLTASVQFEVQRFDDALQVPAAALRWRPQDAAEARATKNREATPGDKTKTVYVERGGELTPVSVAVLGGDGTTTAVKAEGLDPDDLVVVGEVSKADAPQSTQKSPFAPNITRGRRSQ